GAYNAINGLKALDAESSRKTAVLFLGREKELPAHWLEQQISEIRKANPHLWIMYVNTFLPAGTVQPVFDQSDISLIPYAMTEASSNILSRSACAGIPVLGPDKGLLGELIKENRLGETARV